MFCSKCGTQVADSENFCTQCGNKLQKDNSLEYSTQPQYNTDYNKNTNGTSKLEFRENFLYVIKNCTNFSGRASRSEYWRFVLATILVGFLASIIFAVMGLSDKNIDNASNFISLLFFLPNISCATRRLHDVGKSGWWQLISLTIIGVFYLLYLLVKSGDKGDNKYGVVPFIE